MRWILRVLLGLVLLLALAVGAVAWRIDTIAHRAIERLGSTATGVPTTLGVAHVGFTPLGVKLSRLRIANPPGFADAHFFTADSVTVVPQLDTLWSDVLVVPRIEVSGVEVELERRLSGSNYGVILANLKRGAPPEPQAEPGRKPRRVRVDEILVRNITARVRVSAAGVGTQPLSLRIPELRLGGSRGSAEAVAVQVTRSLVSGVLVALLTQQGLPGELAGDLRQGLRGLAATPLGRAEEGARGAVEGAERALRDLSDRLRGD